MTGGTLPATIWHNVMYLGNIRHKAMEISGAVMKDENNGSLSGLLGTYFIQR